MPVPEPVPEPEPEPVSDHQVEYEVPEESYAPAKRRSWKMWTVVGGAIGVVALAVLVSTVFHGATITLTPRTSAAAVETEYTAKKNAGLSELPYEIITVKQTESESVKATGEKQVEKKATGIIVIYNNYSAASQRLIKNTRFATPEGLIFRITDSVNVPGKVGTTPGSVEATVTADEAGDSYNVGLKDFTIPGFKGDPRYTAFYARSKTPISGGFSGVQKVIDDADRAKAKTSIESKIASDLVKQAMAQVPENQIAFDNGYTLDFASLPEESSGSDVILKEEGTLTLVVFDKIKLSSAIAEGHARDYKGEPVVITNIDKLTFEPQGKIDPVAGTPLVFKVTGNPEFEWVYDELALKQALAGQPRSSIQSTLQKFPMIEKADISIRPFWTTKFPKTLDKITIKKS
jgi:hypothetical protein